MTQTHTSKPASRRKRGEGASTVLRTYEVKGGDGEHFANVQAPKGALIVVVPSSAAVEKRLEKDGQFTRSKWVVNPDLTMVGGDGRVMVVEAKVAKSAFEPDARARALLRGVEYAQADLQDAGGAYDVEQVRVLLHDVSRQAVDKKVKEGSLLVVPGPSNRRRFPTVQFNDDGSVIAGLAAVQEALGYSSPWSVLNFLVNGQEALGDEKPIDRLRAGDIEAVVGAARRVGVQGA